MTACFLFVWILVLTITKDRTLGKAVESAAGAAEDLDGFIYTYFTLNLTPYLDIQVDESVNISKKDFTETQGTFSVSLGIPISV